MLDQDRPDLLEDAIAAPSLKPAMDRAIIAELLGQAIPLATGTEAMDDAVDRLRPIDAEPPTVLLRWRGRILQQDRLDDNPKLIGEFPDRLQRLGGGSFSSQGIVSWHGSVPIMDTKPGDGEFLDTF